jgi:two-component system, chemotaxis family, protein-glutamate methylesterase/glutaminase
VSRAPAEVQVVAIGASTGGPVVLQTILSGLPKNFAVPVLIVQHMAPGFVQGFADWLAQSSGFPVHIPTAGEYPRPGHAYVAPDGVHMGVGTGGRVILRRDEPEDGLRPAVSHLFRGVAQVFGRQAVGVLLTGMGRDGAEALKLMRERGAVTIAQDKKTSVVHGMPGEAIRLDAAMYVLPSENIAAALTGLVQQKETAP